MPRKPKTRRKRPNTGLPGEYMKRSLVAVDIGLMGEGGKVAGVNDNFPRVHEEHYILRTRRFDGAWSVDVEFKGEITTLPHKVIAQLERQMKAIMELEKADKSLERAEQARERMKERMDDGLVPFQTIAAEE